MQAQQQLSALSFDLTRLHRRTVTSFYSNLVTRPTGRAVRMGLEQQLSESAQGAGPCLSILDFTQVRVMDYSCADEIVAKLLLRYIQTDRPLDVYFLARGLAEHHLEALEAVLDRHQLLLAAELSDAGPRLLGPATHLEHRCWARLLGRGSARPADLANPRDVPEPVVRQMFDRFLSTRVAIGLPDQTVLPVSRLAGG
jgi:hypothetical protein